MIHMIENLCRTCMGEEEIVSNMAAKMEDDLKMFSIFNSPPENLACGEVTIKELLNQATPQLSLDINDFLPKSVCKNCLDIIIKIHKFQKKCLVVEQRLNDLVKECNLNKLAVASDDADPLLNNKLSDFTGLQSIVKIEMSEDFAKENNFPNNSNLKNCQSINDNEGQTIHARNLSTEKVQHIKSTCLTNCITKSFKSEAASNIVGQSISKEVGEVFQTHILSSVEAFECDECGRRVKTRHSLLRHKRIHQRLPGEKPRRSLTKNKCKYCPKVFYQSSSLKDHMRIHTGEKPFLCSECGKAFKILSNMKQHLLRHGSDRPYECPNCPKRFPCLTDLASHAAVHNKAKTHVCDICGSAFVKPYLLKKHKMYHTGEKNHKCDYCDMRFVLAEQCRRHMRTHTGEKPYKCKYCTRAFAQSNDLTKHLRIHLGDSVYKCNLCPLGFRLLGDLRSHFNTHKNDNDETRQRNLEALKEEELRLQMRFSVMKADEHIS